MARASARGLLRLLGLRIQAHGLPSLPPGRCIVVANHASYLDGILLTAILPPRFTFVIKREMADFPLVGLLLRRLGSLFVDRGGNSARASADSHAILQGAAQGKAIGIFPEGTFKRQSGLLPFRSGAFVTAVKHGIPICPITINGTRRALPAQSYCILAGTRIVITMHQPLIPELRSRQERLRLQTQAREAILSALNEPDRE
nr:lysophospholipid acyltransferase family protein [Natronospira proteinivora]